MPPISRRLSSLFNWRYGGCVIILFVMLLLWKMHSSLQELDETGGDFDVKRREFHSDNKPLNDRPNELSEDVVDISPEKIRRGLSVRNARFYMDGKPFQLLGGSLHYYRFPQEYWYTRLLALKACGLNTVTTYIPWNAHEPNFGTYDFTGMLDLPKFLETAQSLGLYVILRVGPYICAEWEWGGLPSWLLRHDGLHVRSNDHVYMDYVAKYFDKLLPLIVPHQYTNGGPVVAVQVENEFATFSEETQHVIKLRDMMIERGIKEFLFVCDDRHGTEKNLDYGGLMKSINFQHTAKEAFGLLKKIQPDQPLFVSEYWTGWFNTWGGKNNNKGVPWLNSLTPEKYKDNTIETLNLGKNINLYVFVGGTNFGFMNGAADTEDGHMPDTTSYDYDALITEDGRLTVKYHITRKLLQEIDPSKKLPAPPPDPGRISYGSITFQSYVTLFDLMESFRSWMVQSSLPVSFENFPAVADRTAGQAYGYAVYECDMHADGAMNLELGKKIRDRALVFIDKIYQDAILSSTEKYRLKTQSGADFKLTFLVENQGRTNWVPFGEAENFNNQRKGIVGNIGLNGKTVTGWRMWPLDFGDHFLTKLSQYTTDGSLKWRNLSSPSVVPALLKSVMTIKEQEPKDTFMELEGFDKGIVIVNGHNVGRYWNSAGPQRRLFIPGVWLNHGSNEIFVFEENTVGTAVSFHTASGMDT